MIRLTATNMEELLSEPIAVLYKHSPICSRSVLALREITHFSREEKEIPVYIVDVITDRMLSQHLARTLEIEHESPQVILLRFGRPVWHASHMQVRYDRLIDHVNER